MRTPKGFIFNLCGSYMEIKLTKEMIQDCTTHQGDNSNNVSYWLDMLAKPLNKIPNDFVKKCLKSTGAWEDKELEDKEDNLRRFLWLAAAEAKDSNSCWATMEAY